MRYPLLLAVTRHWPSIPAADEANRLMKWREDDEGGTQLEELLCFFVFITKQAKRAHLVLATSDFFLVEWLRGSR